MDAVSYTEAKTHLAETMEKVCANHLPVIITRENAPAVVMLSLEDYQALVETNYLLKSPANAKRLLQAITDLNAGKGQEHDLFPCD